MSTVFGDLAALGNLMEEYRPRLLAMARRRLPSVLASRVDPEEILSDAFIVAQRKYASFRQQSGLRPYAWLYRIVRDCIIETWRRESREQRNPAREMPWPEHSAIELAVGLVDTGTSPSESVARHELAERIHRVLDQLEPRDREILWMRHFDQLSFKEAALVLDIKETTATVRYHRALKKLRELWTRLHPEEDR